MQAFRRPNATRRIVGVALLALLLAQWQALAHAIAHGPWHAHAAAVSVADAIGHGGHANHDGHAGHDADGWGHPAGSLACELFDALHGAQAPGAGAATLPPLPLSQGHFVSPARLADSGPALRAYEARGPPRA
jgi:hypothetical protein